MQMELLKKPVRSYRTIDIRENEEMFEHSIIVPDSKPDVKNILLADAECFVINIEKSGRMIEVSGEIRYRILYCADTPDQRLEAIVTRYPWSVSCQKPKTDGEVGVLAKCTCQHTESNAINGRKIIARTVISLLTRFYEIKSDEMGREILGENVFLKTAPVNVVTLKDNADIVAKVSNILSLPHGSPAIKEVLFSRVNLGNSEISFKEDEPTLEAKGTLYLLYRGDTMDESIESVVLEFPVKTQTGVQAGMDSLVYTTSLLKNWDLEVLEDNDGLNTQLGVNLEIEVNSQAMIHEEQTVIEDAYATEYVLGLNKTAFNVVTDEKELCESHELTQRIRLDSVGEHLDEVCLVCANERSIAAKASDRSVSVQGSAAVDVVFSTNSHGKQIHSHSLELPFTHTFSLPDNGQWQVVHTHFAIEDVSFDISGHDSIEVCIKMKIRLRVAKYEEIVCTDAINVAKEENNRKAPIVLYFAQPNDTLWSIAKNYRIPLSRLAQDNGLDMNARPEIGKRLFIMN